MRRLLTACLIATAVPALTAPAFADGGVRVPLPDVPEMSEGQLEHLLMQVVVANVVSSNCSAYQATDAEWALLTGTGDLIAERLGLSTQAYDDRFYHPAFDLLEKGEACESEGPRVRPLINRLIAWGGSLDAVPIE